MIPYFSPSRKSFADIMRFGLYDFSSLCYNVFIPVGKRP